MDKKFFLDAHDDVVRVIHFDEATDIMREELIQNLDPLIAQNKILREMSRPGQAAKEQMTLMGSVPAFIIEKADRERWDSNDWTRFFNDPDNAVFKTFYGRV